MDPRPASCRSDTQRSRDRDADLGAELFLWDAPRHVEISLIAQPLDALAGSRISQRRIYGDVPAGRLTALAVLPAGPDVQRHHNRERGERDISAHPGSAASTRTARAIRKPWSGYSSLRRCLRCVLVRGEGARLSFAVASVTVSPTNRRVRALRRRAQSFAPPRHRTDSEGRRTSATVRSS